MNRIGAWGLAVAVGIAGAGALSAAEPTTGPKVADAKPWYQRLTGGGADAKKGRADRQSGGTAIDHHRATRTGSHFGSG